MTPTSPVTRTRTRVAIVTGLIVLLMLNGAGVATAVWIVAATTTVPVAAGQLNVELTGIVELGDSNIMTDDYTAPVALTLHNTSPVPVDYTLDFASELGALAPADVELAIWEQTGSTCPNTVPATATTGALTEAIRLPATYGAAKSNIVVCAATRFTGALSESAGRSLTTTPRLTAHLADSSWTATADGAAFTHTVAPAPDSAPAPDPAPAADPAPDPAPAPAAAPALVPAPDPVANLECIDQDMLADQADGDIRLTWEPVPDATGYRIVSSTGQELEVTTNSVDLSTRDMGQASQIDVIAVGVTGNSTEVHQSVHEDEGTLRCG